MAKYHFNLKGEAVLRRSSYGFDCRNRLSEHYGSKDEAYRAYERNLVNRFTYPATLPHGYRVANRSRLNPRRVESLHLSPEDVSRISKFIDEGNFGVYYKYSGRGDDEGPGLDKKYLLKNGRVLKGPHGIGHMTMEEELAILIYHSRRFRRYPQISIYEPYHKISLKVFKELFDEFILQPEDE